MTLVEFEEEMFQDWRNLATVMGVVMEGVIAAYILTHPMPCKNCSTTGTLRWNGGLDPVCSWSDLVCTRCYATYEIKSKKGADDLEKIYKYQSLRGGAFRTFYASRSVVPKRYLLLVSRASSCSKLGEEESYTVYITEIHTITPRLTPLSFLTYLKRQALSISSDIHFNSPKRQIWCKIPRPNVDFSQLIVMVFDEYFGSGAWDRQRELLLTRKTTNAPVPRRRKTPEEEEEEHEKAMMKECKKENEQVEQLKAALEELEVDDWEDLLDSDDE